MSDHPLRIVIFPWLAFGHLLPCLELSARLATRGHRVSFVSTPRNIRRLPPVPSATAALINFVALPLPQVDSLPEGAESTYDVPFEKFGLHRKAFDGLAAPFSAFLGSACAAPGDKPDWVIADFAHHWVPVAAAEHEVPCALILLYAGRTVAAFGQPSGSLSEPQTATGQSMAQPSYAAQQMAKAFNSEDASGISLLQRVFLTFQRCQLFALRSGFEFEPGALPLLPEIYKKPVVPLGLLLPSLSGICCTEEGQGDAVMPWLDKQPDRSVVYVALRSEVPLSVEQVHELALGLELAGTRFLWELRKPSGIADDSMQSILPEGFEERMQGRGLVTMGWVPQIRILAHGSVGGFLTHCGWSSITESLHFGHPLIMLPMYGDQAPNARLMEEKKIGVPVPRDENDGSFNREGVAKTVRHVMAEEEGRIFGINAKKYQDIFGDRECQEKYIDSFIESLRSYRRNGDD